MSVSPLLKANLHLMSFQTQMFCEKYGASIMHTRKRGSGTYFQWAEFQYNKKNKKKQCSMKKCMI